MNDHPKGRNRCPSCGAPSLASETCPQCHSDIASQAKQAGQIAKEIRDVINRARSEYTLALATVVGVLEIVKLELVAEETERKA